MRRVEYTHGSSEMGADFVMECDHSVLGSTEYVGVIAKVGRIQQDYSEVERQIKECFVPRTLQGGKKKVRLGEIWVIVTGTISANAKDKIHHEYASTKLQFLDADALTALIDKHAPDYWTNIDPKIGEYLAGVRENAVLLDKSSSLLSGEAESFYITQDIVQMREELLSSKRHEWKPPTKVNIEKEILDHTIFLIEGGMGAGKSKLLRHLTLTLSAPEKHLEAKLLPILVSYREFKQRYSGNIASVLKEHLEDRLPLRLREGLTPLLLIDGLDESMEEVEQQLAQIQDISEQVKALPTTKIVMTTRYLAPHGKGIGLARDIQRYEIQTLTVGRLVEFLTALCQSLSIHTRIIQDIKRSPLFKELPRSPIAAILLARLLKESPQDLPSSLTELYSKYVELMLGRWDIEKGLQSEKEFEALNTLLMDLAQYMLENDLSGVARSEVQDRFTEYLAARNLDIAPDALLHKALERTGLIVISPLTHIVRFRHRTFAEFLYAKVALQRGLLKVDSRTLQPYWLNTYFFRFGLQRDSAHDLQQFLDLVPSNESERWLKRIATANYCLAAYATPYEVVSLGVRQTMTDLALHYLDIVTQKIDSPLAALSRMQLLYLFQFVTREWFGYGFFLRAFEESALEIDYGSLTNVQKAYALFFVAVANLEAGKKKPFDFLVDKYSAMLPIELTLAVQLVAKDAKDLDRVLKKQERRLRRAFEADPDLKTRVKDLFETPVARRSLTRGGENKD